MTIQLYSLIIMNHFTKIGERQKRGYLIFPKCPTSNTLGGHSLCECLLYPLFQLRGIFMRMFVVSIKDDSGEYVPHGVMSFRAAMTLQFETGRTVYLESIPEGGKHG